MSDYLTLKKKLKALNYNGFFTEESTGIIDRLLQDLIKASEAYQLVKKQLTESEKVRPSIKTMNLTEVQLQTAITTLQKENNELHDQLLAKEELVNKLETRIKRTDIKNDELLKTIEFFQKSGKDIEPLINNTKEVSEEELLKLRERVKFLESHVDDYKAEVRRLRIRYEGTFNEGAIQRDNELDTLNKIKEKEEYYNNQLDFLSKQNEKISKELESYKKLKIPDLSAQVNTLTDRNKEYIQQIERLNDLLKNKDEIILEVKEEIKEKTLQGANSYYIKTIDEYSAKLKTKSDELNELTNQKDQLMIELNNLKNKYDLSEAYLIKQTSILQNEMNKYTDLELKYAQIIKENKELEITINELKCKIDNLEAEKSRVVNDHKKLWMEYETLASIESTAKTLLENNKLEIAKKELEIIRLNNLIADHEKLNNKLNSQIENKERELQLYREKSSEGQIMGFKLSSLNDELASLRQSYKTSIEELEKKKEELSTITIENLEQKREIELINNKLLILEKVTKDKDKQLEELERHNIELKKQVTKLEEISDKFERFKITASMDKQALEKVGELELKLKTIQYEKEILTASINRLKDQVVAVNKDKEESEAKLSMKEKENSLLKEQLLDLEYQQRNIKDVVARVQVTGENREDQIVRLERQLKESKDESQEYKKKIKELEYLKAQAESKIVEFQELKSRYESSNMTLEKQIDKLKAEYKDLEDQFAKVNNQLTSEKNKSANVNNKTEILQKHVEQLEASLIHRDNQIKVLNDDYEKLVKTTENLRNQKDDLLKATATVNKNFDGNFSNRLEEVERANILLKEKVEGYMLIEKDLKSKLAKLDTERDELEDQIDQRNEKIDKLISENKKLNTQIQTILEEKNQYEIAISNLSFKFEQMTEERQDLLKDLNTLISDDKQLKERIQKLEKEKFELTSDLQLLSTENKTISNDLLLLTKKTENLTRKLEQKQDSLKELEYLHSGVGLEKEQLYNNCKIFEKENQRLKYDVSNYERDIGILAKELKEAKTNLYTKTVEYDQMKQQYEILTTALSRIQTEHERLTIEYKDRQIQELDDQQHMKTLKAKLSAYEEQVVKLNELLTEKDKHIEKLTEDYKNLKDNFLFIKKKNDEINSKFSDEIRKSSQLESALQDERQKHANLVHTIHKNRLVSSQIESKIESVEKMFKYK